MGCQVCGKAQASRQVVEIVDGQKRTVQLCKACAEEKGLVIDPSLIQVAASQLKKLLTPVAAAAAAAADEASTGANLRCPNCGLTWKEFRRSNRFGCAHDYVVFGEEVETLLRKIHSATEHRGRISERAGARLSRIKRLDGLRAELDRSVQEEDYEKAAELRDRIRCLEREGDGEHGTL